MTRVISNRAIILIPVIPKANLTQIIAITVAIPDLFVILTNLTPDFWLKNCHEARAIHPSHHC